MFTQMSDSRKWSAEQDAELEEWKKNLTPSKVRLHNVTVHIEELMVHIELTKAEFIELSIVQSKLDSITGNRQKYRQTIRS